MTGDDGRPPRRALILAGGGLKVAAQAGALQVWLDEAKLTFDHVDGASGGVFNLAMMCQGMTGRQIADNWRRYRPLVAASPNIPGALLGPFGTSLLTADGLRKILRERWRLDWPAIRQYPGTATFNVYDFTHQRLEVVPAADMTEDLLVAAVALPIWFSAVGVGGRRYIDAVFATDANIEYALDEGADEAWIIWTVSRRGRWRRGWVNQYFQMVEACANSRLQIALDAITANNTQFEKGEPSRWGRQIEVNLLEIEVPLHYLINFRSRRFARAVDLGVEQARAWCFENDKWPGDTGPGSASAPGVLFSEVMKGDVQFGASDAEQPPRSSDWHPLTLKLNVHLPDVRPEADGARAGELSGVVECEAFGGRRPITDGHLRLMGIGGAGVRTMKYELTFRSGSGQAFLLVGRKDLHDDKGCDLWPDTTTLHTTITSPADDGNAADTTVAAGAVYITASTLVRMLFTFRTHSLGPIGSIRAQARFLRFFLGALRSVYAS